MPFDLEFLDLVMKRAMFIRNKNIKVNKNRNHINASSHVSLELLYLRLFFSDKLEMF